MAGYDDITGHDRAVYQHLILCTASFICQWLAILSQLLFISHHCFSHRYFHKTALLVKGLKKMTSSRSGHLMSLMLLIAHDLLEVEAVKEKAAYVEDNCSAPGYASGSS
ncbi:unnamed protein product [Oncorhynchus mykiss]|uniref:Uncharacterized protein n=1 Tax=Oncorhynchus mykiss TaxID=8022 RepID=A0A060WB71_ONCMY|nr:unnamed protein product [Oncorhynchus mykiss]